MKRGKVYYKDFFAGIITQDTSGYFSFVYDTQYVAQHLDKPLAFSLPVRAEAYTSERLFSFFDGLIPEGWLLNILTTGWKIRPADRMSLLLACCSHCIGAVSIRPFAENEKDHE